MLLALLAACGPTEDDLPLSTGSDGDAYAAFVMSAMAFTEAEEDGSVWGFDLDGVVTESGDTTGCGKTDLVDPEGHKGIDNAFAGLMPVIANTEAAAIPGLLQDAVDGGELLLVIELNGLDDWENDDDVTVTLSPAIGTPMIGTNGTLLSGQTFDRNPEYPSAVLEGVALVDGRLVASGVAVRLSLQVLDAEITLDIPDGAIQIDLDADGAGATGHFGGGFSTGYLMEVVDANGIDDGLTELLRSLLPALADLDGEAGRCEYMSVDFQYEAVSAFFFED